MASKQVKEVFSAIRTTGRDGQVLTSVEEIEAAFPQEKLDEFAERGLISANFTSTFIPVEATGEAAVETGDKKDKANNKKGEAAVETGGKEGTGEKV